jgi:hypothetical protein
VKDAKFITGKQNLFTSEAAKAVTARPSGKLKQEMT